MDDIRFNLSASYEDMGWDQVITITEPNTNSAWLAKFGDCRGLVANLQEKKVFKLIKTDLGTYFSYIIPNEACSRNGCIQLSLFFAKGLQAADGAIVVNALRTFASFLPSEKKQLQHFFERDPDVVEVFKKQVRDYMEDRIKVKHDFELENWKYGFDQTNSLTAYRCYTNEAELVEFFSLPNQSAYKPYCAIAFIPKREGVADAIKGVEIKDPLQHILTVDHNTKKYYLVEGGQFEIQLQKYSEYANVEPRTLMVKGDRKDAVGYRFTNDNIIIDEDQIEFSRRTKITLLMPDDVNLDKFQAPILRIDKDKVEEEKDADNKAWVYNFRQDLSKEYELKISDDDFSVSDPNVALVIKKGEMQDRKVKMVYARKLFRVKFVKGDKELQDEILFDIRDAKTQQVLRKNHENNKYVVEKGQRLTLEIHDESPYELCEDGSKNFTIEDIDKGCLEVRLKNKSIKLVIEVGSVSLEGNTYKIGPNEKKYAGFKLIRSHHDRTIKIKVIPSRWKLLSFIFIGVSALLLASTLVFGFVWSPLLSPNEKTPVAVVEKKSEKIHAVHKPDSLAKEAFVDSLQERSSIKEIPDANNKDEKVEVTTKSSSDEKVAEENDSKNGL